MKLKSSVKKNKEAIIFRKCPGVVERETANPGEFIIMSMKEFHHYYKINAVAAEVWQQIDGRRSLAEIVETTSSKETGFSVAALEEKINGLFESLSRANLIESI